MAKLRDLPPTSPAANSASASAHCCVDAGAGRSSFGCDLPAAGPAGEGCPVTQSESRQFGDSAGRSKILCHTAHGQRLQWRTLSILLHQRQVDGAVIPSRAGGRHRKLHRRRDQSSPAPPHAHKLVPGQLWRAPEPFVEAPAACSVAVTSCVAETARTTSLPSSACNNIAQYSQIRRSCTRAVWHACIAASR